MPPSNTVSPTGERLLKCANFLHPTDDDVSSGHVGFAEPVLDLVDEVEETHATILEKLDEIKMLREKLRKEYVPSTVVSNLEQCIKETEVRKDQDY